MPYGKDCRVILSDGTIIHANAGTTVTFPLQFTGPYRKISVNGEAYLQIAKNAELPFIVQLPDHQVQVLGTSFNVNTYEINRISVSLVEGVVNVKRGKETVALTPGKEAISMPGHALLVQNFDKNSVLSWRHGVYTFKAMPSLLDVFHIVPRFYGVEVQLGDTAALKRTKFKLTLNHQESLDTLLNHLKNLDNTFRYHFDEKHILHIP